MQLAHSDANDLTSRARGEAASFVKLAAEVARSPQASRERIWLEAMERILATTSERVVPAGSRVLRRPLRTAGGPGTRRGRARGALGGRRGGGDAGAPDPVREAGWAVSGEPGPAPLRRTTLEGLPSSRELSASETPSGRSQRLPSP